jgi:hypothetical protein
MISCSEDDSLNHTKDDLNEAINTLISKGIILDSKIDGKNIKIIYPDGLPMNFELNSKTNIVVSDTNGIEAFKINFSENNSSYLFNSFNLLNENNTSGNPKINPDHEGQDFCQCYKNDVDEFCDGVIGCVALLHPLVQAVIVVHCVIETGTMDCDDE